MFGLFKKKNLITEGVGIEVKPTVITKPFTCDVVKENEALLFTFDGSEHETIYIANMLANAKEVAESIPDGKVSREYVSQILPLLFPHRYV